MDVQQLTPTEPNLQLNYKNNSAYNFQGCDPIWKLEIQLYLRIT